VAVSDLYPHISFKGTITYQAALFKDLFSSKALSGTLGPSFQWNILNYGRILFNVRLQDARFQELVAAYQQTVLNANKETEDGLVTFLKAHQRARLQRDAAQAGKAAVDAIRALWQSGLLTDYTRVAQLEQNLVLLQDVLAQAEGEIALGLIQVFKGLGGGWQIRCTDCTPTPLAVIGAPEGAPRPLLGGPLAQPPELLPPPGSAKMPPMDR
jgi:outer membrane protein TolC